MLQFWAVAKSEGYDTYALTFNYHQRHKTELVAAERVVRSLGASNHMVIEISLDRIGGSALTSDMEVPKSKGVEEIGQRIPVTYVPARNTIFLSFALAWAEVIEAADIYIGVNALDYSGYPDCRPEFIRAFEQLANLAIQKAVEGKFKISIHTPLIKMTKAEIIKKGIELGVDFSLTHSCYDPDEMGRACGFCDSMPFAQKRFY